MQKLKRKDKKLRIQVEKTNKNYFVLKSIFQNSNFFTLIRWNAFLQLTNLYGKKSRVSLVNKCIYTNNKKRLNKITKFSRHVFLKQIRFGKINGAQKASW